MGTLEDAVKTEIRRGKINDAIIGTVATAGIIAAAVLAPNVLGALGRAGFINRSQKKQSIKKSLTRLIERGYTRLEGGMVRLTPKGEKFAALMGEGKLIPKRPRHWDGKWRVLIFDIPERRKKTREHMRRTLMTLGFKHLQDSVWVYPYDCEDLITLLKADLKIGRDLLYMIVDKIEYDKPLKVHFGV